MIGLRGGRRRLAYGVLVDNVDGFVSRDRCVSEFLAVFACSNVVFGSGDSHGESPCFSRCDIMRSVWSRAEHYAIGIVGIVFFPYGVV